LLIMQFLARPLKVFISTIGSNFNFNERLLLAWIGPRGIVAAAVSAVFALRLEQLEVLNAELLVPLAFSIIIGTVVIQSATARPFAKWLGVSEPDTEGFLIIGASPVSIAIAKALEVAEIKTILCDTQWENISKARMENLKTYYGNPISDHADLYLDLSGLGGMLGLSPFHSLNTAAALRFREDFGIRHVFTLASAEDDKAHSKHRASEFYKGQVLFKDDLRFSDLNKLINSKTQVKRTQLSESYDYSDWQKDSSANNALPLFAIDTNDQLHWFTAENPPEPEIDWSLYALYQPDKEK